MKYLENVAERNDERLTDDWRDETIIFGKYNIHNDNFLQLLSRLKDMWDGNFGRVTKSKHLIELESKDTCSIQSAPYFAVPMSGQLGAEDIQATLQKEITEPATTE